jgi:hypothetical protein
MMVSTIGVNVQANTELNAELFGEVRINFVSETLPLDRFVDSARLALVQKNSKSAHAAAGPANPPAPPSAAAPAVAAPPPAVVAPPAAAAPPATPAAAPRGR